MFNSATWQALHSHRSETRTVQRLTDLMDGSLVGTMRAHSPMHEGRAGVQSRILPPFQ